jgi:hypothetical protein
MARSSNCCWSRPVSRQLSEPVSSHYAHVPMRSYQRVLITDVTVAADAAARAPMQLPSGVCVSGACVCVCGWCVVGVCVWCVVSGCVVWWLGVGSRCHGSGNLPRHPLAPPCQPLLLRASVLYFTPAAQFCCDQAQVLARRRVSPQTHTLLRLVAAQPSQTQTLSLPSVIEAQLPWLLPEAAFDPPAPHTHVRSNPPVKIFVPEKPRA